MGNLRSGAILTASIHSLLRGRASPFPPSGGRAEPDVRLYYGRCANGEWTQFYLMSQPHPECWKFHLQGSVLKGVS